MAWDFAEANPLEGKLDFSVASKWVAESLEAAPTRREPAKVFQYDAASVAAPANERVAISTDPPYYDNIGYADLSDFFYVWLRRTLRAVDPETFQTVLTPKSPELIASPYRHGGSAAAAEAHFRDGFATAFKNLHRVADPTLPMTVYYAFKQSETKSDEDANGVTSFHRLGNDVGRAGQCRVRDHGHMAGPDDKKGQICRAEHERACLGDCHRLPGTRSVG